MKIWWMLRLRDESLDRLVGYKLSPILWSKVRRGLSAGRVQSVALRLIVEREREIEKFKKEPYFTIKTKLKIRKSEKKSGTEFKLTQINGEKIEETKKMMLYDGEYKYVVTSINTEEKAKEVEKDLKRKNFIV